MNYSEILSQMLLITAILVVFVNIITEVVKGIHNFKSAQSLNIFVTVFSVILTVITLLAYWQLSNLALAWYKIAAFVVVGFMVAYAAMFGYDKLLKYFEWIK